MTISKAIVFISGGNDGIGRATATQISKIAGYHVIIGSRNAAAGEKVAAELVSAGGSASSVQLDLLSDESIAGAVKKISQEYGVLDVLINNAGVLYDVAVRNGEKKMTTRELFDSTYAVNVTGTACLTEACEPLLRKSTLPRVIFVSSSMGSVAESLNKSNFAYSTDYKAYDCSKAAMNMLATNYARILEDAGALVNAVCPGFIKTKLTGFHEYATTTDVGATRLVELATATAGGQTGTFTDRNGEIPW